MKNIVVISAHPDDEVLGLGGTLLKHSINSDNIFWIITTKISQKKGFLSDKVKSRQIEIDRVKKELGIKKLFQLNFNTMNLSSETTINMIEEISSIFKKIQPEIIYCVNRTDAHSDHRHTFDAVAACTKSFRFPSIKMLLLYECISETEFAPSVPERVFQPNYFVDITNYLEKKIDIMKIYDSEIGDHPFPRSEKNIRALATFRGAMAGVIYAEAFQLIKFIDK
tara:strand:+ start:6980 stop:7651 length:672 start_codon:yes stop_codon:yes gene_type:complete